MTDAFDFCVSSSNALQQCPSLRGGGGELPAAAGRRGPVEPQRYSNTTDWMSRFASDLTRQIRQRLINLESAPLRQSWCKFSHQS